MRNNHKVAGILLAGGVGSRMGAAVPKQFLEVCGKPIICYPLEAMEKNGYIDFVEVVCVETFIEEMQNIIIKYGFSKTKSIVKGGATCQESTYNGLKGLRGKLAYDDIVLIHMSSYPLADSEIISGCIESAEVNGSGCTARPIQFSVYFTDDRSTAKTQIDRDKLMLCTIPYAFKFGECLELYDRAFSEGKGIIGNVFTNTLYCDYGKTIHFTKDSSLNIKVTTSEDIVLMRAILDTQNHKQDGV